MLQWTALESHKRDVIDKAHLKQLLQDATRNVALRTEYDNIYLDFSRQRVTPETMKLLFALADATHVKDKIAAMAKGEHINVSENRAVGHIALRAAPDSEFIIDGVNVVPEVWKVLNKIKDFSERVRNGTWKGATGKPLRSVIAVGIGGSYLGAQFVYEALVNDATAAKGAHGRQLHFLANVDPVAVQRAISGLDPAETLVVVISKTFTTRETMLNATTIRQWITDKLGKEAVAKHMVAVRYVYVCIRHIRC